VAHLVWQKLMKGRVCVIRVFALFWENMIKLKFLSHLFFSRKQI
jgi:hypothetical protein